MRVFLDASMVKDDEGRDETMAIGKLCGSLSMEIAHAEERERKEEKEKNSTGVQEMRQAKKIITGTVGRLTTVLQCAGAAGIRNLGEITHQRRLFLEGKKIVLPVVFRAVRGADSPL